jgi:type IV pilus assembly protein PilA
MRKLHTRKGGFTLIELMIVVAIIGILAAIAIPNFLMFQLRSKTGEAKTNLAAIRTAEEGYFAEFGSYVAAVVHGNTGQTPTKQSWGTGNAGFQQLGWAPEGEVFFQYAVTATGPGVALTQYTADAQADLDGSADGLNADFGYVHPIPGQLAGLAGSLGVCPTGGVSDGTAAGTLLNAVGPCTNLDGQSEF